MDLKRDMSEAEPAGAAEATLRIFKAHAAALAMSEGVRWAAAAGAAAGVDAGAVKAAA